MAKPIAKHVEFDLANGWVALNEHLIIGDHNSTDQVQLSMLDEDRPQAAAVLIALAQHLLALHGDPEVSKSVLLEAGLLEASPLRGPLNVLKVLNEGKVMNELRGSVGSDQTEEEIKDKSNTKTLLREDTIQRLHESGLDPDITRFLGSINGCARALNNNSVNPAKAAQTMMKKPWAKKAFPVWLEKNPSTSPEIPPFPPDDEAFAVEDDLDV